jgi:putative heme-binding domain-containing protein
MTTSNFSLLAFATLIASVSCFADESSLQDRNDAIIVRAVERMKDVDFSDNDHVQQAIARHIERQVGTVRYVDLAARFRPDGMIKNLTQMVLSDVDDSVRVRAMGLLLSTDHGRRGVRQQLNGDSIDRAKEVATVLALLGNGRSQSFLAELVSDSKRPYDHRKNAMIAMASNQNTSKRLLSIAEKNELPPDTRLLAGGLLSRSNNQQIRKKALELFPQPEQKDRKPLLPLDQLAQLKGDPANGAKLFSGIATCGNCHPVAGQGKQVGPDLSEIGGKLSREAMLTSILDPNAGISHNYEGYVVLTADGQVISGLLISKTEDEVVIRTADAIDRKIQSADIESMKQSEKSIMPENIHQTIDQKGLVDIVEYMTTLKKK